jgi:hypothetical protein
MSYTLTLEVPENVYNSLKKAAERTGKQPEAVAIQLLADATKEFTDDPLEQFIGAFSSQVSDWADQHDKYLGKSVAQTMREKEKDAN